MISDDLRLCGQFIRFRVRERDFMASVDVLSYFPESYLAWVVNCSLEDVKKGLPIRIDRQPIAFKRMLERMRYFYEMGIRSNSSESSTAELPPSPVHHPPHRRAMDPCTHPNFALDTFNRMNGDFTFSCQECQTGKSLSKQELTLVVEDAILDVVSLLDKCLQEQRFFDKAVFVLTWGANGKGSRVLRPYVCHLFDSVTARMVDVLRVTNGCTLSKSWQEFEFLYASANLSPEAQHLVKDGLRRLGFGCMFSDLKIDPENFLHWRLVRDGSVRMLDNEFALRCLVVSL